MEKLPLGLALDLRKVVPYQTGSWRTMMPVNLMQTPPCTHSCPAGIVPGIQRKSCSCHRYKTA